MPLTATWMHLAIIIFMLNTMGQDCKGEKLSQQLPHEG